MTYGPGSGKHPMSVRGRPRLCLPSTARQSMRHAGFIILSFVLLSACTGPRHPASLQPPIHRSKPEVRVAALERQVHRLINEERRRHGLSLLAWDDSLASIARKHSRDMAVRRYFAHESPEGHGVAYRYRRAGYRCARREGNIIYTGADNILQNNLYDSIVTVNGKSYYDWNSQSKIAETTVQGWMKSPGHRKNILTPSWRREGIGVYISPDDKVYITENFC